MDAGSALNLLPRIMQDGSIRVPPLYPLTRAHEGRAGMSAVDSATRWGRNKHKRLGSLTMFHRNALGLVTRFFFRTRTLSDDDNCPGREVRSAGYSLPPGAADFPSPTGIPAIPN
jgi:hypothetical protein